jgi:hypothetical protein
MTRLLEIDQETFRKNFNHKPFLVKHRLVDHPLFSLPRLIELSRSLPEHFVKYNRGNLPLNQNIDQAPRTGLSIEETIRRIEEHQSWMVLRYVQNDPEYRACIDQLLDEIQELSEPLDAGMMKREGFIFISSADSVTPYHMDPEHNFLLQIRGTKYMNIFDGQDRSILAEEELETFYSGKQFDLTYRDEYQQKAMVFELTPGLGVHNPLTAPHWVKVGPEVSISFSITFRTRKSEERAAVYSMNSQLRKMGLTPTPFGRSTIKDSAKVYMSKVMGRAKALAGKRAADEGRKY